jgi:alpha-L-fucosidase
LARNEWALNVDCIPPEEYETLADTWKPKRRPMREWAKLAVAGGMKYMVMTTKHHEGFCLWDSKLTDYNAVRRGPGRDLVAEYVDACREFGLKCGFYYSLMDWHHPDGFTCSTDEQARRRFIDYTHGLVRELMSHYGKVDILWYDVAAPLKNADQWESLALNSMVRKLQPQILINDRSFLAEDFSTPEGNVNPSGSGRGWEACMTFNDVSWGYMPSAARDAHGPRAILKMLHTCSAHEGNLLLNIGPDPDGSVPPESVAPIKAVGQWLKENGEAVYGKPQRGAPGMATGTGCFSRKGKTAYFWCRHWMGPELVLGGFKTKLKNASFLKDGKPIRFTQKGRQIIMTGLPKACPDKQAGITVIKMEFASAPKHEFGQFKLY